MNLQIAQEPGLDNDSFRMVLDTIRDGVYVVDRERRILYWNKGAEQLSGYSAAEVVGRCCNEGMLAHVDECGKCLCEDGCPLAATINDRSPRRADVFMHHKDGHRVPVNVEAAALLDQEGNSWGAVEVFYDNSEDQSARRTLRLFQRMAMLDSLTGLPNRRFMEHLIARQAPPPQSPVGLMLLDIDHFKRVNDKYGHETGDRVLKAVAKTLKSTLGAPHAVGRWGGEEFLAVLVGGCQKTWIAAACRVLSLVEACFVDTPTGIVRVTISAGMTSLIDGEAVEAAIEQADRALYKSKADGRNLITLASAQRFQVISRR